MATNLVKMQIQFRRDTAANWELHGDVIPAAGEPCFVIDKNILKIGDGETKFKDLEPINGVKFEIAGDGKSIVLEDNVLKLMGFEDAPKGAQPRKGENGAIEWVVPSTEVTDKLQASITKLETSVGGLQTDVAGLTTMVGSVTELSGTLLSRVDGLDAKMTGTGEGTVDAMIDAKINEFAQRVSDDGTINTIQELINYVANHGGEVETLVNDISTLQGLVGSEPVGAQIDAKIKNSGHITKVEAESTLLSKIEAKDTLAQVKYEVADAPIGTLVDYGEKEIRVMVPANAQFVKQNVGTGGDTNTYYFTFKTYAPKGAVGYIEHLGGKSDNEVLIDLKTDKYGRKYQPTWLGIARYDEATNTWAYYGKNSTANHYIGWDYQIDWYDENGVMIASDCIRINLSNEGCHNIIEPYYAINTIKGVSVNGTLLDMIDGKVDITIPEFKSSDEITVNKDGTLSIKAISFNKMIQGDTTIVMDGGSAV